MQDCDVKYLYNLWELPVNNTKKIALAAAILCSAGTALAQDSADVINPSWYIAPTVVGIKPDHDFGTSKKDWGGGLKFGKAVHPLWDIQIGATHARVEDNGFDYHQTLVGIDSLLMLSRKTVRPYLLLGLGAEKDVVASRECASAHDPIEVVRFAVRVDPDAVEARYVDRRPSKPLILVTSWGAASTRTFAGTHRRRLKGEAPASSRCRRAWSYIGRCERLTHDGAGTRNLRPTFRSAA